MSEKNSPRHTRSLYGRVVRRETHSPRSILAIVLAVSVILMCAWAGTEIVLNMLGQRALLVAPNDAAKAIVDAPAVPAPLLITGAIITGLIGLLLILAGVAPGRRARHAIDAHRSAAVVDNEVIASALARHASRAGGLDPDNSNVSVSHRSATLRLTPASGIPVSGSSVTEAVTDQLDSYKLRPPVRPRIVIEAEGKVGA